MAEGRYRRETANKKYCKPLSNINAVMASVMKESIIERTCCKKQIVSAPTRVHRLATTTDSNSCQRPSTRELLCGQFTHMCNESSRGRNSFSRATLSSLRLDKSIQLRPSQ